MHRRTGKRILITGAAGFIGFYLCRRLIDLGDHVIGLDNLNDYYDVHLKIDRLKQIEGRERFKFIRLDLADKSSVSEFFSRERFDMVVNLAAQAGVRYSLVNPHAYIENNISGFLNVLEGCRHQQVRHLVFASSSSVYGANTKMPFSVHHNVDHPVSLYGATKKANELMAHAYSILFQIPCTGLRFFTVYGPWGRPDMVLFIFSKAILEGKPIDVFNYGRMQRDFTYIDDVTEGIVRVMDKIPGPNSNWNSNDPDPASGIAPYRLYNIGNNNPVELMGFIEILENCLGKKAKKNLLPMQAGDVPSTYADVDDLMKDVGFKPSTPIEVGIQRFVDWYRTYYGV
ncbi:MAG: capsular biosynthesis protein CpsI [Deltaproteobacteria bacterium RBG_16_48_10]|nr:MAG: capsular biosynthesis protein CpsI [Deltaproteobacteria bacterium RBG_16_48_10]